MACCDFNGSRSFKGNQAAARAGIFDLQLARTAGVGGVDQPLHVFVVNVNAMLGAGNVQPARIKRELNIAQLAPALRLQFNLHISSRSACSRKIGKQIRKGRGSDRAAQFNLRSLFISAERSRAFNARRDRTPRDCFVVGRWREASSLKSREYFTCTGRPRYDVADKHRGGANLRPPGFRRRGNLLEPYLGVPDAKALHRHVDRSRFTVTIAGRLCTGKFGQKRQAWAKLYPSFIVPNVKHARLRNFDVAYKSFASSQQGKRPDMQRQAREA